MDITPVINKILKDIRVELTDEFDRNFERKAFFGEKWPDIIRCTGKKHRYTTKSDKTRIRNIPPKKDAFGRRPILTGQMGDIGGSLEIQTGNGETIVKFNFVYSAIHNDGGRARCRI